MRWLLRSILNTAWKKFPKAMHHLYHQSIIRRFLSLFSGYDHLRSKPTRKPWRLSKRVTSQSAHGANTIGTKYVGELGERKDGL